MELLEKRPVTDFRIGVYTYEQIQDSHFMYLEEQKAHEEIKRKGWEYAYTPGDMFNSGRYVRYFRVWTSKEEFDT